MKPLDEIPKCATCNMELLPFIDESGGVHPAENNFCDDVCRTMFRLYFKMFKGKKAIHTLSLKSIDNMVK